LYLNLKEKEWMSLLLQNCLGLGSVMHVIQQLMYTIAGGTIGGVHESQ
jgi:hypothetical protein